MCRYLQFWGKETMSHLSRVFKLLLRRLMSHSNWQMIWKGGVVSVVSFILTRWSPWDVASEYDRKLGCSSMIRERHARMVASLMPENSLPCWPCLGCRAELYKDMIGGVTDVRCNLTQCEGSSFCPEVWALDMLMMGLRVLPHHFSVLWIKSSLGKLSGKAKPKLNIIDSNPRGHTRGEGTWGRGPASTESWD